MSKEVEIVHILVGRYSDGSGFDLLKAYVSEEQGKEDLALLKSVSTLQEFSLEVVPLDKRIESSTSNA